MTDLRRGVAGPYALILVHLAQEPLSGAVYAFCNRRRDTVRLFAAHLHAGRHARPELVRAARHAPHAFAALVERPQEAPPM